MRKTSLNSVVLLILFFFFTNVSGAYDRPTLEGHWEGIIDIPGMTLEVDIDFKAKDDGSWEGDISIPVQKAKDLPLTDISVAEKDVSFVISGVPVLGDEFILEQVKIISVKFLTDKNDNVIAAEFIQPNGIYEAKRVNEK